MSEAIEVIKAVNELINAQADQLWDIAISIIVAEVFIIAHLVSLRTIRVSHWIVVTLLCLSVLSLIFSLACGYLSKGQLISAMIDFAASDKWKFPDLAALFNLLQVGSVTLALIVFVVCFFFYSRILARAMIARDQA
jgi:hypothetical protein